MSKDTKKPPHRPLTVIDWKQVDLMCAVQCTGEEMASILGIHYDTLATACKREKGCTFSEYFEQKRSTGKMSLRRQQFTIAMKGNPTMLVWLGKNWLGQTDKVETINEHKITAFEVIPDED
jgi:predicted nucleic-acid-binding Zn-ribbon protein